MSWFSKVLWSEGLFLRPHHLQQNDRYFERLLENRVQYATSHPWGFSAIEVDLDLARRAKFGLRRGWGVMRDGTPFKFPDDCPAPDPIDVPDSAGGQLCWLMMPEGRTNEREVDDAADSASRYTPALESIVDSTLLSKDVQEIDVAHPRLTLELRKTAKPGYVGVAAARIVEVREKTINFDQRFVPPILTCGAHPVVEGWMDRVIGWMDNKVEQLARYAADPTAGAVLQNRDYFVLQLLNRETPVLKHFRRSRYLHPERLYEELLRIAGELATFAAANRRARDYKDGYDHDDLQTVFEPVLRDIQDFLSAEFAQAFRLEIIEHEQARNVFTSPIRDRSLFRTAAFIMEVGAKRPLTEIQSEFPELFKVGPNTKMGEIVRANLPGIALIHLPTPPPQIPAITQHVYFAFDKTSPLWPEFSTATSIGMHFAGDWPELELELWAVPERRQ